MRLTTKWVNRRTLAGVAPTLSTPRGLTNERHMPSRGYRKGISDAKVASPCYARTRLSIDQLAALDAEATARGVTISNLLRALVAAHLTGQPVELSHRRGISSELIREFARLGNNLNQVAHMAHLMRLPQLEVEARAVVERLNATLDRLA